MPRPVYSTRFLEVRGLTTTLPYVVPAGVVAVVRDVDAFRTGILGATVIFHGAVGQAIWGKDYPPGSTDAYSSWRGRQVFLPGETFDVQASNPVDVTVSGYLLSLP